VPSSPCCGRGRLLRDAGGYRLPADGDSSDLPRFRALRDEGRRLAQRSPARALELLTEALSLWRGPIADGLPAQVRTHPAFDAVDRERLAALREAANAATGRRWCGSWSTSNCT
jgi:hypothetical protein